MVIVARIVVITICILFIVRNQACASYSLRRSRSFRMIDRMIGSDGTKYWIALLRLWYIGFSLLVVLLVLIL